MLKGKKFRSGSIGEKIAIAIYVPYYFIHDVAFEEVLEGSWANVAKMVGAMVGFYLALIGLAIIA